MLAQFRCRPHAGELQELRRIDRTRADDDFAPRAHRARDVALAVLHAGRLPALEQDAGCERMRLHGEIRALHRGAEVRIRRAAAPSAAHRHVEAAETFLLAAVDVGRVRIARLTAGFEPRRMQRIRKRAVARLERARVAAVLVAALGARLCAPEVGQHGRVVPAGRAFLLPAVEILRIAAHVDESVDRGGAAQHLAARRVEPAAAEARLRFGVVAPVVLLHAHRDGECGGHLHEEGAVRTAVLEDEHGVPAIRGEPVRQHATGRSRADDDVVELLSRAHRCRPWRHTRSSAACSTPSRRARSRARGRRA